VAVSDAFRVSTRDALVTLADDLGARIDRFDGDPHDRLMLVRAYLGVLRDLESYDRAKAREARLSAAAAARAQRMADQTELARRKLVGYVEPDNSTGLIDELRARRGKRRAS